MNHSDIRALVQGVAPVLREYVAESICPLVQKIDAQARELSL